MRSVESFQYTAVYILISDINKLLERTNSCTRYKYTIIMLSGSGPKNWPIIIKWVSLLRTSLELTTHYELERKLRVISKQFGSREFQSKQYENTLYTHEPEQTVLVNVAIRKNNFYLYFNNSNKKSSICFNY